MLNWQQGTPAPQETQTPSRRGERAAAQGPERADDEINLGDLLLTLWKGKGMILAAALAGGALSLALYANTRPVFQADALIQLEEKSGALALPSSFAGLTDSDPRSVTEIEIVRSRMVLGQAVAERNLDWRIEPLRVPVVGTMLARFPLPFADQILPDRFIRPGESLTLAELVVPPQWLNLDIGLEVTGADRYRVTLPDGRSLEGQVGRALRDPDLGFSLDVGALNAAPGRVFTLIQIDENRAVTQLRERLTVQERGRASGILGLAVTGQDREENVRALDAILQSYLRQNIARSAAEADGSLQFIREQLPQAERNLRTAEAALNAFRQQQVTVDLSLETQTLLGSVTRIEAELIELQRREDELAQRFTPSHPSYRLLLEERARLQERLGDLREQVGTLPETQRQIVNLTRDVELAQRLFLELQTRAQEVEVVRASTIGNVRIVDMAASGRNAIQPRRTLMLALGIALGLMAGVFLVLVRNWMRKGVQDATELEQLGLPVFATINYSRQADTGGRRKGHMPILALEKPDDLTVEAFRSLRTSLHFGMLDAQTPTLSITSAHPEAGKSFLATNLAVVTAQAGQKVCLIDADMRRGQLRRYFGLQRNQPGLAEVLSGAMEPEEAVLPGPHADLFFMPAGRYPPNPSELLMRAQFGRLLDWCSSRFDLTIIDTPPILAVTDATIIGRLVGATLFVARHDMTPAAEVEASIKTFAASGLRFTGALLNGFDPRKAKAGYVYGYGYRYTYQRRDE